MDELRIQKVVNSVIALSPLIFAEKRVRMRAHCAQRRSSRGESRLRELPL